MKSTFLAVSLWAFALCLCGPAAAEPGSKLPGMLSVAEPAAINSWIARLEGTDEKSYTMRISPLDQPSKTLVGIADTQGCGLATIDGTLAGSSYNFRVVHTDQAAFENCCAYTVTGIWNRAERQGEGIYVNDPFAYNGSECGGEGELILFRARR